MRHPGLCRPHFDVSDATVRTLYETRHSFLHIKDHATGRANRLESIGHLLYFRLVHNGHELYRSVIYRLHSIVLRLRFISFRWQVRLLRMSGTQQGCRTGSDHVSISNLPKDQVSMFVSDMT